jgi:glycosyltransferase involved in cell wall biosynthesis
LADAALVKRIAVVLPHRENFVRAKSGAVALCARDFARHSRFCGRIDVVGAGPCDYADVSYRRLQGWRRWWRRDREAYAAEVAEALAGYALIEAQNRPPLVRALRRRLPDAKIVLHLHNDPQTMDGSRSPAERSSLLEVCDAVYCVSAFIRGRLLEGVEDPAGKVFVTLNGVAFPQRIAAKAKIVAFTGRVVAIKGVGELVRAFAAADLPDWRLVVAGSDPDGVLASLARERAALGARFEWRGQVSHDEAMELLAGAEIAAAPSMWDDPCPRAAIEALAQGCALVASRRGGLPEIAGDAALFVDPADTAGFAAALRGLARDAKLRADFQARARARAGDLDIGRATARIDAVRVRLLGAGPEAEG